jgi:predicted dehydrogenase
MTAITAAQCADVAVIAEPDEEMRSRAAESAPGAVQVSAFDEIWQYEPDGVVIATPSALHAEQTLAALERRLPVFCQKPLGRNRTEVAKLTSTAKRVDRLLDVDLSYRWTAPMRAIRRAVQAGELGEIFAAELVFHNAYGPQKPWFYDPRLSGGGCVMDLGIHLVDALLWTLGDCVTGVRSRVFHGGARLRAPYDSCEDYAVAQLDLAGGAVANLTCSWNLHAGCDAVIRAIFHGSKGGMAMLNVNGSFIDFACEQFHGTSRKIICEPPDEWGGRAAVDWARRIRDNPGYNREIEQIVEVTGVLDAIYANAGLP